MGGNGRGLPRSLNLSFQGAFLVAVDGFVAGLMLNPAGQRVAGERSNGRA